MLPIIEERLKDPEFFAEFGARYYSRRWGFLHTLEMLLLVSGILVPGGVLLWIGLGPPARRTLTAIVPTILILWIVTLIGMITANKNVFAQFAPAKTAQETTRRFAELRLQLFQARGEDNPKEFERVTSELASMSRRSSFRFDTLASITYNDYILARGGDVLYIPPLRRLCAHILP